MNPHLSLWVLMDAMTDCSPTIQCKNKKAEISELRLYQPGMPIRDHILYIAPSKELFLGGDERIVLKHRSDLLFLETTDLLTVLNRVQDIFSRYTRWYDQCTRAITAGCPLSELLELTSQVLPFPIIIVNAAQVLVAHSKDLSGVIAPEDWGSVNQSSSLPDDKLIRFNQFHNDTYYQGGLIVIPPGFFPTKSYCYHILVNEDRLGTIILKAPHGDHTPGTLHLFELFSFLVHEWVRFNEASAADFRITSNFAYTLDGTPGALTALSRQLSLFDWAVRCKKQVFVIASPGSQVNFDLQIRKKLAKENLGVFSMSYRNQVVILCNLDMLDYEDFTQNLCAVMQENHCCGASSIAFTALDQLVNFYQQALTAVEHSPQVSGQLYRCQDSAMRMITNIVDKAISTALIHPAIPAIKAHDLAHKTDYCRTLHCFLKNERRHQQTAEELFIHRNTLFLRLEKIHELWPLDLSDPEERFYLLFSFYQELYNDAAPTPSVPE